MLRLRSNVTSRVVPYAAGAHPCLEGSFVLLDFPEETAFPTEVYAETLAGDIYPESADQISRISLAYERIADIALSPAASAELIGHASEELPST